jgi:hypothetical protein
MKLVGCRVLLITDRHELLTVVYVTMETNSMRGRLR